MCLHAVQPLCKSLKNPLILHPEYAKQHYLVSIEMLSEEFMSHPAHIDGAHPHVQAKQEEVSMVTVTYTVIQPR